MSGSNAPKSFSALVEDFAKTSNEKTKRAKHNRTLSLDVEWFLQFQSHCKERGVSVSDMLDKLIYQFLQELLKHEERQVLDGTTTTAKKAV